MTDRFTQEDAFELYGCGHTGTRLAAWRRMFRIVPGRVQKLLEIRAAKREALEAAYDRGYADGRCQLFGMDSGREPFVSSNVEHEAEYERGRCEALGLEVK